MPLPLLRVVACVMLVCFVSACHTRTRVALPEGSPSAAGRGPQDVALKVKDTVRVTLRDGSHLSGLVSAIELDALTVHGWRDSTRPTDDRRIRWSDIVLLEHVETSAGRTTLFILSVPIVAMISAILAFALSPNGGR